VALDEHADRLNLAAADHVLDGDEGVDGAQVGRVHGGVAEPGGFIFIGPLAGKLGIRPATLR
jgi:hypothetical protein